MQIKILKYHAQLLECLNFKKLTIPTKSKDAQNRTSGSSLMEYRIIQLLWMTVSDFLIMLHIELAYDPTVTLLNMYNHVI